jgi:hypothetical protein
VDALLDSSDMLAVDYKSAGIDPRRVREALSLSECLGRATWVTDTDLRMTLQFPALRTMLLEESYRAHNPAGPAWVPAAPSPVRRRFVSTDAALDRAQAIATLSDCIVEAAPREADALVRTQIGSAAQTAGMKPLIPHLSSCVPAGLEVTLDPVQLRAIVADGLWTAWRFGSRTVSPADVSR